MRFPVWVACCERTLQLLVRRRAKHVWIVAAVIVLLIFFFKNITLTDPTEPLLRRSYSPSEGIYGISVVYTAPDKSSNDKHSSNDNNNDSNNEKNTDNKSKEDNTRSDGDTDQGSTNSSHSDDENVRSSTDSGENDENNDDEGPESESEISNAVAASRSSSQDGGALRVRELPFQTEPDFKVYGWEKFYGGKNSFQPKNGTNATIPPAILKIISDAVESDGNETYSGESQLKTILPEKTQETQPKSVSFINKIVESLKAQARNPRDNNFLLRVLDFFGMNPSVSSAEKNNSKPSSIVAGSGSAERSEENLSKEDASYASKDNKHPKTPKLASGGQSSGSDSGSVSLRSIVASMHLVSSEGANGTSVASKLNSTWKVVQKDRKRLLKSRCEKASTHHRLKQINAAVSANGNNVNTPQAIIDRDKFLLFCPVQNAASTMLKRLLFSLDARNHSAEDAFFSNISSPEDLPFVNLPASLSRKGADHFVGDSVRFLITRDPFVRIFAAYLDHLLVPNVFYWKHWGVTVVSRYRHTPSQRSTQCGHDVMFPEFVKYVIETLHASDPLLQPVHALCAACQFKFSALGHVETLRDDFEYLTALLGVSVSNYSAKTFMDDVSKDVILNSTYGVFQFFKELKPCVSKHEIGKRLWRKLQMMGIISDDFSFPLSLDESVKKNTEDFIQLFLKAREKSQNIDRLLAQKYQALKEAYSKVPTEHILKLVETYSLDFELFGYSKDPRFLDVDI